MLSGTKTELPHEALWNVTTAGVSAKALNVVADLGVADHIDDAPVSAEELGSRCGVDAEALDRVLRLLVAHGIFERREEGYQHSETSRLLRSDHPMSMRAFARMFGLPLVWGSLGRLDHSVRTVAPAVELVEPRGFWAYLQAHPDEARIFDEAMAAKAGADIAAILGAYDFGSFQTIADIGGGRGHLLRALLDTVPTARGVLFDLPGVIGSLDSPPDRLSHHAGDFFVDPLPRADGYLLMEVIHDWADAEARSILRGIRSAASAGAVVLIIEAVMPDHRADPRVHALDVVMLTITGGRERTARSLGSLLHSAGFRVSTVIETGGPLRIVEAVAV